MKKVYLGGAEGSEWADRLIPKLKIDHLVAVSDDTVSVYIENRKVRSDCELLLFVIDPDTANNIYAIAVLIHICSLRPMSTSICVLDGAGDNKFSAIQLEQLETIEFLIKETGATIFRSLENVADYLNTFHIEPVYNPNIIECTIDRGGTTQINLNQSSYLFEANELGDYVCEVLSEGHRRHFLRIPEFRIYKQSKAPETALTPREVSFTSKWQELNADDYLAFVNGHIDEFNNSKLMIRELAVKKWLKLLPDMESCPVSASAEPVAREEEPVTKGEVDLSGFQEMTDMTPTTGPTEDDEKFLLTWKLLTGERFKACIEKNEQKFLDLHPSIWEKARIKWERLITDKTGEVWPFEEVTDDSK